jgi:ATP-dependent RNA helicase SUPV3L1/SUV3
MFKDAILSFSKFCVLSLSLPAELHIKLSDIIRKAANVNDLFPFFLNHAYELFPHLKCMPELKIGSDLTEPAFW